MIGIIVGLTIVAVYFAIVGLVVYRLTVHVMKKMVEDGMSPEEVEQKMIESMALQEFYSGII